MRELGEHLRHYAAEYNAAVHRHFFATVPQARQVFPHSAQSTHPQLAPAVAWVLENLEEGSLPPAVAERLRELGLGHRRHGFPAEIYPEFARSLLAGLEVLGLTTYQHQIAARTIKECCRIMQDAAHAADVAGQAPAYSAQVVAVERPNRRTAVIRVESGAQIEYLPGQHFQVTSQLTPGTWRELTPANPSDPTGQMEFHLAITGEGSQLLSTAQPGDWWTLGTPAGTPPAITPGTTLISFGTGWAAARALLLDQLARGAALDDVHLVTVAPSPGKHYDTETQANLAALAPQLRVTQVVREAQDPWLLGAQPPAAGFAPIVAEDPMQPVLAAGTQRRFVLVGPADRVEVARASLLAGGVDAQTITKESWQRGHEWAASAAELDGWENWEAWAEWKKSQWAE
ncbi:FAD-binding oxidoreductase [Corynebacterium sp.]|uniref:FAD-binding oxidoreductase n=1 Tax=Corynebacterium sp. TaxID=1720 RepID=UPI0026DD05D6|nr:FAD-binding oxidoreductase [Corynebacterium sp.]MDO5032750.1 FAD-binding oxidoreductase [Corynebacterium sp.]